LFINLQICAELNLVNFSLIFAIKGFFFKPVFTSVARYFINVHKAEIGIVVNKKAKVVSFRRAKQSKVDVSILAKTLCDGGGSVAAAGGRLTEKFGELTKQFKIC